MVLLSMNVQAGVFDEYSSRPSEADRIRAEMREREQDYKIRQLQQQQFDNETYEILRSSNSAEKFNRMYADPYYSRY